MFPDKFHQLRSGLTRQQGAQTIRICSSLIVSLSLSLSLDGLRYE